MLIRIVVDKNNIDRYSQLRAAPELRERENYDVIRELAIEI